MASTSPCGGAGRDGGDRASCLANVAGLYLTYPKGPAGDPNKVLSIRSGSKAGGRAVEFLTTMPRTMGSSYPGAVRWALPTNHAGLVRTAKATVAKVATRARRVRAAAAVRAEAQRKAERARRVAEYQARQAAERQALEDKLAATASNLPRY